MKRTLAWAYVLIVGGAVAGIGSASAHKLAPTATAEERRITEVRGDWLTGLERRALRWGLPTFGDPVHEEITNRIYGCDGSICDGMDSTRAPAAVLAGVRWNDDPPFRIKNSEGRGTPCKVNQTIRFQTQPTCWYLLFRDAAKRARSGVRFDADNRSAMLYRTHFGDLQFLHAMASQDAEPADETRRAILEWTEFNWRLMTGEFTVETPLKDVEIPTIQQAFGTTEWMVQDLYTQGSPRLRREIKDVAFGSLLHTLQDSFAEGHVERASATSSQRCPLAGRDTAAPGRVIEFHSYALQDHALHGDSDSHGALQEHLQSHPDVVEIGRVLRDAYDHGTKWRDVSGYFGCIYALSPSVRPASPGEQYQALLD